MRAISANTAVCPSFARIVPIRLVNQSPVPWICSCIRHCKKNYIEKKEDEKNYVSYIKSYIKREMSMERQPYCFYGAAILLSKKYYWLKHIGPTSESSLIGQRKAIWRARSAPQILVSYTKREMGIRRQPYCFYGAATLLSKKYSYTKREMGIRRQPYCFYGAAILLSKKYYWLKHIEPISESSLIGQRKAICRVARLKLLVLF